MGDIRELSVYAALRNVLVPRSPPLLEARFPNTLYCGKVVHSWLEVGGVRVSSVLRPILKTETSHEPLSFRAPARFALLLLPSPVHFHLFDINQAGEQRLDESSLHRDIRSLVFILLFLPPTAASPANHPGQSPRRPLGTRHRRNPDPQDQPRIWMTSSFLPSAST